MYQHSAKKISVIHAEKKTERGTSVYTMYQVIPLGGGSQDKARIHTPIHTYIHTPLT